MGINPTANLDVQSAFSQQRAISVALRVQRAVCSRCSCHDSIRVSEGRDSRYFTGERALALTTLTKGQYASSFKAAIRETRKEVTVLATG